MHIAYIAYIPEVACDYGKHDIVQSPITHLYLHQHTYTPPHQPTFRHGRPPTPLSAIFRGSLFRARHRWTTCRNAGIIRNVFAAALCVYGPSNNYNNIYIYSTYTFAYIRSWLDAHKYPTVCRLSFLRIYYISLNQLTLCVDDGICICGE